MVQIYEYILYFCYVWEYDSYIYEYLEHNRMSDSYAIHVDRVLSHHAS